MDRFKRNPRSYRLIAPFMNDNDNILIRTSEATTPIDVIIEKPNKYNQLHDEIAKEANVPELTTGSVIPEDGVAVADIDEEVIHELAISSFLPVDGVPEANIETSQTVLLDISKSIPVSHHNLKNTVTGNDDNISVCSEIGNAYKNLIQLENCEFRSTYLNSMLLNTSNDLQENDGEETQGNSCLINNAEFSGSQERLISSPSIINTKNTECLMGMSVVLSPLTTSAIIVHNEDDLTDPLTTEVISNENHRTGRPKKGRKRKYADQTREIRKELCQTNKIYINTQGNVVEPREFIDVRCNDGCHEKIPATERESEFLKFWNLSFEGKSLYISSNVKVIPIKRKRNKESYKRTNTRVYSLRKQTVCAKMFINTLRISSARIDRYLKKTSATEKIEDKRGKQSGKKHKMSQDIEQSITEHIDKFPKYQSHYCRAKTNRMFLPPDMTLQKMFDLYLSEMSVDESREPVSFSSYKKIFYSKFNLQRKKLQKDTCNKCDIVAVKIRDAKTQEEKIILENERELHHKEAEDARAMKKQDMILAKTCDHLEVLTFDMEKTLPLPRIPTNIVFYKRQLWLYNCGVHSGKTGKGFCYVWVEGTAGRGAQEVGSSLRKHISSNLDSKIKELILWSDSCGGQNRNIKLTLLLFSILDENTNLEQITLRFMIPGHSFLENDSDFSDIESALKTHSRLYSPQDYIDVMTTCRKRNRLTAVKMEKSDFVGVSKIMKNIVNRKKTVNGEAISWLKTKEISIYKDKPGRIYMSTSHGGKQQEIDINKRQKRGRNGDYLKLSEYYEQLWPEGKQISQPKLNDIKSLLHLIPSDARHFYENLTGSDNIVDDVEGFSGSLDFELEDEN